MKGWWEEISSKRYSNRCSNNCVEICGEASSNAITLINLNKILIIIKNIIKEIKRNKIMYLKRGEFCEGKVCMNFLHSVNCPLPNLNFLK